MPCTLRTRAPGTHRAGDRFRHDEGHGDPGGITAARRDRTFENMAWLRDPDRPVLLSVVFWLVLGDMVAVNLAEPSGLPERILFLADVVLLGVLWTVMPRRPGRRRLVAPAFLACTLVLVLTGSAGTHLPLLHIGVVDLAFVYGMRVAALILAAFGVITIVVSLSYGTSLLTSVIQTAALAVLAAFSLGRASALLRGRERTAPVRGPAVAEERAREAGDAHGS